jgi:hypothetical protein
MKKLIILICLAAAPVLHADDLLVNPSFETQGDSMDTAASWNRWGDWINRETGWNPTHSGQCLIGYHHWQITSANNSGIWQEVQKVKAGQLYKFSIFACVDQLGAGANPLEKIELRLEATRDGKQVTINSATYKFADFPKDGSWMQLSVSGQTPENNLRVLVIITPAASGPRGGAVKLDDATLELR